jgi:hypothetical protein
MSQMLICERCGRDPRDHAEHRSIMDYGLCKDCYGKELDKSKLITRQWCEALKARP